jgi:hypothetical protein
MILDQALRRWVCGPDCVTCPTFTLTLGRSDSLHAIEHTKSRGEVENTVGIGVRERHNCLSQSASRRVIAAHPKAVLADTSVPNSIDPSHLAAQSARTFGIAEENRIFVT